MPSPSLELDRIDGAQIQTGMDGVRIVRTGMIHDIDTTVPPHQIFASAVAIAAMPSLNSAYPASPFSFALLRNITVDPVRGANNKARVALLYTNVGLAQLPPSTFIIENRHRVVSEMTQRDFNTGAELAIAWKSPVNSDYKVNDIASVPVFDPWHELTAWGYYIGTPPDVTQYTSTANATTWRGRAPGYWLFMGQSDRTVDRGGSYEITLSFLSRVRRDWSEYSFLRDPSTGRVLPPDNLDFLDLRGKPYKYGKIQISDVSGDKDVNGVIRVGSYPTVEFNSIFGFGSVGI